METLLNALKNLSQALRNDERGFILSIELVLIATICVIGLIAGLTAIRDAIICELSDVAGAVQDLTQTYTYNGVEGHSATTSGSDFLDALDHCDDAEDASGAADNCITISAPPTNEQ